MFIVVLPGVTVLAYGWYWQPGVGPGWAQFM